MNLAATQERYSLVSFCGQRLRFYVNVLPPN